MLFLNHCPFFPSSADDGIKLLHDRNGTGYISTKEICQFERENGYMEVSPEDFIFMINCFDLDGDGQLNYHDFLQVLLPCNNPFLRSAAT